MNAPRDPWADFAEVFAEELKAGANWTPQMMDAYREEYEREQIAAANSEQAQADNVRAYSHE